MYQYGTDEYKECEEVNQVWNDANEFEFPDSWEDLSVMKRNVLR